LAEGGKAASGFDIRSYDQGDPMPTTFQKRQKEMKRQEKARSKAERRQQKKLEGGATEEEPLELLTGPRPLDEEFTGPLPYDRE
jgi:hypothetical protein